MHVQPLEVHVVGSPKDAAQLARDLRDVLALAQSSPDAAQSIAAIVRLRDLASGLEALG